MGYNESHSTNIHGGLSAWPPPYNKEAFHGSSEVWKEDKGDGEKLQHPCKKL